MAIGSTLAVGAATAAGLGAGRLLGARRAKKLRERYEGTVGGAAEKRAQEQAAARQISGQYGSSAAKMRQDTGRAAEGGREEARQARREMLANVVKGGGFGRSGAATDVMTGISQAQAANEAQAGRIAADISQSTAQATQAADRGTLDAAAAMERMYQKRRLKMMDRAGRQGAALARGLASSAITRPAGVAAGASAPIDAADSE